MAIASPSASPARASLRRSASHRKIVDVDLTVDSEADGDSVRPLKTAPANGVKRKRIELSVTPESEQEANPPSGPVSAPSSDTDDGLDDEEYEVEYIVDSRYIKFRGKKNLEYLIHWTGYSKKDRSWTQASQFENDDPPVLAYYQKNPTKPGAESILGAEALSQITRNAASLNEATDSPASSRPSKNTSKPTPDRSNVKSAAKQADSSSTRRDAYTNGNSSHSQGEHTDAKSQKQVREKEKAQEKERTPNNKKPNPALGIKGFFTIPDKKTPTKSSASTSKDKENIVPTPDPSSDIDTDFKMHNASSARSTPRRSIAKKTETEMASKRKEKNMAKAKEPPAKRRKAATPDEDEEERQSSSDDDAGSDFVMDDEEEDGHDKAASDDDDGDFKSDAESEAADEEDEDEPEEEEVKKSTSRKVGGWNVKVKAPKKAPVNLNGYKTGVKPLGQKLDIRNAIKAMSEDLPPMNDIEIMFDHLVSRMPDIVQLVKRLNGRKLRVATMCSGTESPLLALNMIAKAIKAQHDLTLSFDHVFSCEIEPFKQAYIERNFSPPVLFRDVTELGKKKAHTAYGSLVEVPGNVDILIAGTSCVDYSNLNNVQQDIDANGESGRTFRGMLQWVKKHQPPIVILENVCNAPWDKVVGYFAQIDYDAQFTRLDTKEFYIPHTRTRVYLFATPCKKNDNSHLADKWANVVKDLRRPWSSPFEAFLLHTDDPNIHRARLDLASAKEQKDGTQRKATDWGRCESRHHRARQDEALGILRPLTSWQEAGVCKGLDWTWNDWLLAQTERVLDLLEISTLRMAKEGTDSGFKACIWNVSQNVDRQAGSSKTALASCLTPNMIPWVTTRGGPVTGREALALQGIPVRELLLTSENEDQLADLAGNAMTTTVVGASMLAALKIAVDRISAGQNAIADAAKIEEEAAINDDLVSKRIVGEENLEKHDLDLAKVAKADLQEILDLAERSSKHCQCEGQSGTASPIEECSACGYRACKACGGRPDHHYVPCQNVRVEPTDFEKRFKELLPMRVKIAGITQSSLSIVRQKAKELGKGTVDEKDWNLWSQAVIEGVNDAEFRFRYLKRQYTWTAVYEAPNATLDLFLQGQTPEWRLTIKAPPTENNNSRLRALLLHPVARLRFDTKGQDVLCGPWELCVPSRQSFQVEVNGRGKLVPTWQAALGLQAGLEKTQRWSQIEFVLPQEAEAALDRKLSGTYTLLPKCGQAMSSLHKKDTEPADKGLAQMYFFLDPTRCGESDDDSYVFSTSIERIDYGTERAVLAVLEPKWRESSKAQQQVRLDIRGGWVVCEQAHLTAVGGNTIVVAPQDQSSQSIKRDTATFAIPPSAGSISVNLTNEGCTHASALLSCRVPIDPAHSESMWRPNTWGEIDLLHQGNATFSNLAWITERLPPLDGLSKWTALADINAEGSACERCAPRPPKIHWIKKAGKLNKNGGKTKATIIAFEDKLEAGRYEHALKNRPAPFVVQLRLDKDIGSFRIGLNIVSLAHRALSRLPVNANKGQIKLSWKLTPGQVADVPEPPRVFILPSNKRDPEHAQPEGFKLPLRVEQLRSLWWMKEQEAATGKTHTFVEEEISEAALPSLGWRAEGKAERPVMIRGGVIADQVGYGKTIISLALIAESKNLPAPDPAPRGLIDLKATLIVVPGHLSKQWPSEITRFTGKMFNIIVIQNMRDLQLKSISDLSKADIIVMASEIFEADGYWERFEYLSSQPEDWLNDKQGGRFFSDRLETAYSTLRDQVQVLAEDGSEVLQQQMKDRQRSLKEESEKKKEAHKTSEFGKRMKGKAYRDKYDDVSSASKKKGNKTTVEDIEKWEASEGEEESDEDELAAVPVPTFRNAKGTESFGNSNVHDNYKKLACPVMHMFRFRRVIADEFTYLDKKSLAALLRLSSCYKWVLSGTPPVSDFPAIRSIAAFMGIHLGMPDDAEGNAQAQKARAKEQTQAEKFHAFREIHSQAWHRRRDDLAQEFLNVFVRQNIAEIDDIPTVEHIHEIKLPASEGAVYLELEHHLQALEMQARRETKFKNVTQGDRNARLEEALVDSKTAEEALLKRCCHFTLDLTDKKRDAKSAQEACEHITGARSKQLIGCEEDLYRSINEAVALHCYIKKKGGFGPSTEKQHFKEWVDDSSDPAKHQGDSEAAERLIKVLAKCGIKNGVIPSDPVNGKAAKVEKGGKVDDVKWQLREQSHLLRKLSKELVARVRSLRFFEVVRKLQRNGSEARAVLEASECGHKPSTHPEKEMSVLSCCGHVSCLECMTRSADQQRCVKGSDCHSAVRHTNIVKVKSLGIEGELSSGRFGAKLQKLVDLIHSIPTNQRILVFLQWEDLAGKVSEALTSGKISHVTLSGSVKSRANTLDRFQQSDPDDTTDDRVLLLKVNDASAAGSNLTIANHVIFLGPLFTNSLLNYRAVETQAIGRIRRYGQEKKVHIHRLLALDTIDMTIFQSRRAELMAKPDYEVVPLEEYKGKKIVPKKKKVQNEDPVGVEVEVEVEVRVSPKKARMMNGLNSSQSEPIEID
uniref:DNA repair protein Rad8 n=1 Tax=Kwoniella dejecticola CBS 10117 TaxID=1296121 RepID=A0A1A6AFW2_9TREE|nr:DNA repair protein Rad8 [Kwoniella dejecticola CBS 10117]OBR88939.1 DNA repair protein Rad8 [Kwoniella dejecticola CBS 10117]